MVFDTIHNYYETQVIQHLNDLLNNNILSNDEELLNDIACVALNQLPSRYIRHDVDMAFYLSSYERDEIKEKVSNAVRIAIEYVKSHQDNERPNTYSQAK